MSWFYLFLAIAFEIAGTTLMKYSQGFTVLLPSIGLFVSYFLCFTFLTLALKGIDLSIAYAIWCGAGILAISLIGIFLFHEQTSIAKFIFISLIIIGVIGLKLLTK